MIRSICHVLNSFCLLRCDMHDCIQNISKHTIKMQHSHAHCEQLGVCARTTDIWTCMSCESFKMSPSISLSHKLIFRQVMFSGWLRCRTSAEPLRGMRAPSILGLTMRRCSCHKALVAWITMDQRNGHAVKDLVWWTLSTIIYLYDSCDSHYDSYDSCYCMYLTLRAGGIVEATFHR